MKKGLLGTTDTRLAEWFYQQELDSPQTLKELL